MAIPRSWSVVGALVILAVIFVIIGILYQSGNLQLATSANGTHFKHALVAWGLAVLSLAAASFARPRPA
jgi:hypothetical protein